MQKIAASQAVARLPKSLKPGAARHQDAETWFSRVVDSLEVAFPTRQLVQLVENQQIRVAPP